MPHVACCLLPCCLLSGARRRLSFPRCPWSVACCTLPVACRVACRGCSLHVACSLAHVACCPFHAARCVLWLHVVHCMAHVVCLLHAACRLVHFSRCMSHVVCCLLPIFRWCLARCLLRVVCGIAVRWILSACPFFVACHTCSVACFRVPAPVSHVAWRALSVAWSHVRISSVMYCVARRLVDVA